MLNSFFSLNPYFSVNTPCLNYIKKILCSQFVPRREQKLNPYDHIDGILTNTD